MASPATSRTRRNCTWCPATPRSSTRSTRPRPSRSPSTTATASRSRGSAGNACRSCPSTCGRWPGSERRRGKYLDAARFHAAFHPLRSPKYLVMSACVGVVGIVKLARVAARLVVGDRAVAPAVQGRASTATRPSGGRCTATARKTRAWRGAVLGAELFAIVLTLVLVAALAPWWAWLIVAAVAVPPLAHYGQAGAPADRAVGGDDAAGAQDQHRRDRPRVRAGRAVLDRPEEAGRPPRVRLDDDPRRARQGLARSSSTCRTAARSPRWSTPRPRSPPASTWPSRRSTSPGQAVRAAPHAARPRRRPAVRARGPHAAARLQAAVHLAQGPVRPRPVRPQGRVLPACGSRC